MKTRILSLLILTSLIFASSCDKVKTLEDLKSERSTLLAEKNDLETRITELEKEINRLDTTVKKIKTLTVKVDTIKPTTFRHFINIQGKVESRGDVMASPKMSGVVTNVYVEDGDQVRTGQLIAKLDGSIIESSLRELETGLELANIAYEKQKRLWEQEVGTEMQFLQAKNQKESLERRIATTREQLAMTRVKAPISGTVDKVYLKVGEAAMPGMPAAQIVNLSDMRFVSQLSESYIGKVHKGDKVEISFPGMGKEIESSVIMVGQSIHPVNRTVSLESRLPSGKSDLKANMSGEVVINDKTIEGAVTLPQVLVQSTEMGDFVYLAVKNEAGEWVSEKRKVSTGLNYDGQVVIEKGIEGGELVVTFGQQDLSNGQPIKF